MTVPVLRIVPALGVWSHQGMVIITPQPEVYSFQGWSTRPLNSANCSMEMNPLTALECG